MKRPSRSLPFRRPHGLPAEHLIFELLGGDPFLPDVALRVHIKGNTDAVAALISGSTQTRVCAPHHFEVHAAETKQDVDLIHIGLDWRQARLAGSTSIAAR